MVMPQLDVHVDVDAGKVGVKGQQVQKKGENSQPLK